MIDYLIQNYVEKMTTKEIEEFAYQNGIVLQEKELLLLLSYIKKDWRTIVHGNPRKILEELEKELEPMTYQKMISLYQYFKEKYQNYL